LKNFALKYPFVVSVIVLFIVFIGVTVAGWVLADLVFGCQLVSPSDSCNKETLGFAIIWNLSIALSFILGIFASIGTYIVLLRK
jgi:hypothetical protein